MKTLFLCSKRLFDVLSSGVGLLLLCPFLPIVFLLIKRDSAGPLFFAQQRVGRHRKLFWLYKLRSMRTDAPKDMPTHLLQDATSMITPLGNFLRRSSLDELPQLWNIFKGDMSVVGPRPALWNQEDLVALREEQGANAVRPGLTGLAQVMGRDELSLEVKAQYDGDYVRRMNPLLDAQILWKTVLKVLKHEGVREGATKPTIKK